MPGANSRVKPDRGREVFGKVRLEEEVLVKRGKSHKAVYKKDLLQRGNSGG